MVAERVAIGVNELDVVLSRPERAHSESLRPQRRRQRAGEVKAQVREDAVEVKAVLHEDLLLTDILGRSPGDEHDASSIRSSQEACECTPVEPLEQGVAELVGVLDGGIQHEADEEVDVRLLDVA